MIHAIIVIAYCVTAIAIVALICDAYRHRNRL